MFNQEILMTKNPNSLTQFRKTVLFKYFETLSECPYTNSKDFFYVFLSKDPFITLKSKMYKKNLRSNYSDIFER